MADWVMEGPGEIAFEQGWMTMHSPDEQIRLYIDDRKVIDDTDDTPIVDGTDTGESLGGGKIGFRQMKWTDFRYRNFRVHALSDQ